jgi:hypothetical protein
MRYLYINNEATLRKEMQTLLEIYGGTKKDDTYQARLKDSVDAFISAMRENTTPSWLLISGTDNDVPFIQKSLNFHSGFGIIGRTVTGEDDKAHIPAFLNTARVSDIYPIDRYSTQRSFTVIMGYYNKEQEYLMSPMRFVDLLDAEHKKRSEKPHENATNAEKEHKWKDFRGYSA